MSNEALEAYFTAYCVDADADLVPVADALKRSRTSSSEPPAKGRRYACLVEGCAHVFKTWGDAQLHMKDECGFGTKKPNQGASYAKARTNFRTRLKKS